MSNLDKFISLLMSNDEVLQKFLEDPITTSEINHGLTKAERSVLRRTVHHLSNNSVNGYSLHREYGSYRRSLRLLQNVLHNSMAHAVMEATNSQNAIVVYYPNYQNGGDYTGYNNETVGNSYLSYLIFLGTGDTIGEVMANAVQYGSKYPLQYGLDPSGAFVLSFTIGGFTFSAIPSSNPADDFVFWFYSLNGKAGQGKNGFDGESFTNYPVNPGDVIFWQLIAPDKEYGFQPCVRNENNNYYKRSK